MIIFYYIHIDVNFVFPTILLCYICLFIEMFMMYKTLHAHLEKLNFSHHVNKYFKMWTENVLSPCDHVQILQENNLQLLIGTINLIEWLRWDLKEEMQDNDKYNQCTTEWNMCIIKVDKDCDYIPLLMAKVFLQPDRWCTACRQTCASIWRWPWKNSTNHRPHSYLSEAIVWKTSNKVLNKEISF